MRRPTIGVGADAAGFALKESIRLHLESSYNIIDFGILASADPSAYPDVGFDAAEAVASGELERAILVCGTGIGMCISANKVAGVRAAVAHDFYSVERSVLSNNCQILALGARVIAVELALRICDHWLDLCFDPGSHSARSLQILARHESRHIDDHGYSNDPTQPSHLSAAVSE